jgi:chromosome partitioning protein
MGKVIVFAQQKGGAGKTTVLSHLAHSWTRHGAHVEMVDLDEQGSLSTWAGLNREPALTCITSKPWRAEPDIREARAHHDLVLVDCPGNVSSLLESALRVADLVIVPCQPTGLDVWATASVLETAARQGTPARVLLNRVAPRGRAVEGIIARLQELGAEVLENRLGNRVAFATGFLEGTTSLGLARKSTANDEVEAVRGEIDAILAGL